MEVCLRFSEKLNWKTALQGTGIYLNRNSNRSILQANDDTMHQAEKVQFFGAVFTSDGSQNETISSGFGKVNADLHELQHSIVTERKLSNSS